MQDQYPTHMTIGNFMNDYIVSNQEKIFSLITKAIFKECKISMYDLYLDGSKFEANANKYKFVWKPTTFHNKLSDKNEDFKIFEVTIELQKYIQQAEKNLLSIEGIEMRVVDPLDYYLSSLCRI